MTHTPLALVIDDDPAITDVVSTTLSALGGYRTIIARNGQDGLYSAFAHPPDIIVVDIGMPELNGLQFIAALRGDPATANIPIVILSARVTPEDTIIGLMTGADRYLHKPLDPHALLTAIEAARALNASQRADRIAAMATDDSPPTDYRWNTSL